MGQFGQEEYTNPVSLYVQFKAGGDNKALKGKFFTYDKALAENVSVDLGQFIVLKTACTIVGYSDKYEAGIYSNTVEYLSEELDVRTHKSKKTDRSETIAVGLYKEIKGDVLASGGRLHRVVYALLDDGRIAYITLKGKARMSFDALIKVVGMNKSKVRVSEVIEDSKGATKFLVPVFGQGSDITAEETEFAKVKLALINKGKPKKDEDDNFVNELLAQEAELEASEPF